MVLVFQDLSKLSSAYVSSLNAMLPLLWPCHTLTVTGFPRSTQLRSFVLLLRKNHHIPFHIPDLFDLGALTHL